METNLSHQQSMKIIQEMIATSRNNLKDNSFFYLLWGWLVLVASVTHFVLIQVNYQHPYIAWPILMSAGAIASVIAGYRMGKKSNVISHVDKMMIYLWYGFLAVIILMIFMAIFGLLRWTAFYPLIISLYGLGTFVSGGVLKFRPLILGGISCWIISVIVLFIPGDYVLLMTALSVILSYLIPGYILKSKS